MTPCCDEASPNRQLITPVFASFSSMHVQIRGLMCYSTLLIWFYRFGEELGGMANSGCVCVCVCVCVRACVRA